jgi:hypothetical protein
MRIHSNPISATVARLRELSRRENNSAPKKEYQNKASKASRHKGVSSARLIGCLQARIFTADSLTPAHMYVGTLLRGEGGGCTTPR